MEHEWTTMQHQAKHNRAASAHVTCTAHDITSRISHHIASPRLASTCFCFFFCGVARRCRVLDAFSLSPPSLSLSASSPARTATATGRICLVLALFLLLFLFLAAVLLASSSSSVPLPLPSPPHLHPALALAMCAVAPPRCLPMASVDGHMVQR